MNADGSSSSRWDRTVSMPGWRTGGSGRCAVVVVVVACSSWISPTRHKHPNNPRTRAQLAWLGLAGGGGAKQRAKLCECLLEMSTPHTPLDVFFCLVGRIAGHVKTLGTYVLVVLRLVGRAEWVRACWAGELRWWASRLGSGLGRAGDAWGNSSIVRLGYESTTTVPWLSACSCSTTTTTTTKATTMATTTIFPAGPAMRRPPSSTPVSSTLLLLGQSRSEHGGSSCDALVDKSNPGRADVVVDKPLALQTPASYLPPIVVTSPSLNEWTTEELLPTDDSQCSSSDDDEEEDLSLDVTTVSHLSHTALQVQLHQAHRVIRQRERDLQRVARLGSNLVQKRGAESPPLHNNEVLPTRNSSSSPSSWRSQPRSRTASSPGLPYDSYGSSSLVNKLHLPSLHRKSSSWSIGSSSCDLVHAEDYFGSLPTTQSSLPAAHPHLGETLNDHAGSINMTSEWKDHWPDVQEDDLVVLSLPSSSSSCSPASSCSNPAAVAAAPHRNYDDTHVLQRTQARATEVQRRLDGLQRENSQLEQQLTQVQSDAQLHRTAN